ncbi:MAG TPA: 4a-hydroxytetrahydrobiopterin dehydratase [Solirubrobacterales bacterium]|jgi:4a-hydroxytetrahydrobiopterin dehydratase|nr:4a-hydroxytetrahydrobiopterin dehydratase [Solirubrobacterales bacterium]
MALLSDEEIKERLKELDGWRQRGEYIVKSFDRGDFVGSVRFVDSLVEPAEDMNHHPDIAISWSQVEVAISTHAEGGLTDNDFELARKVDALA